MLTSNRVTVQLFEDGPAGSIRTQVICPDCSKHVGFASVTDGFEETYAFQCKHCPSKPFRHPAFTTPEERLSWVRNERDKEAQRRGWKLDGHEEYNELIEFE